jgi:LPS export ABC transporter permease LptF/LPS export ABC transporter permease LptG
MLRLIDRYLIRSIITPFFICLLVFTFIQLVPYLVRLIEPLVAKGVPAATIFRAVATLLPMALAITIPTALLVALLVGMGKLSGDREWVALQSCGVSVFGLLRPVAVVSVLACAATLWVQIWGVPSANQAYREIVYNIAAERAEGEVRPRVFFEEFPNSVLYVRDVPPDGRGWLDVFLADTKQPDAPVVYLAERGRMVTNRQKRTVELILENGAQHVSDAAKPENYSVLRFRQMVLSIDPNSVFPLKGPDKGDREKTVAELRQTMAEIVKRGGYPYNPIIQIQQKFSIPVACIVFGLLAPLFGLTTRRDGKFASFIVGIAIIFAYYVIMWTSQSMAKGRWISAYIAMWMPNILLGGPGLVLLVARGPWGGSLQRLGLFVRRTFARLWPSGAVLRVRRRFRHLGVSKSRSGGVRQRSDRRPWLPRPSLLDAYVSKLYLRIVGLSFTGLMGIFYISTFIDMSDKLFKGKTTGGMLAEYMWYASPQFMYYCIPLGVLIATLVTIGLLTRSSELIVMRACGISLYRTTLPLVLMGVLASGLLFMFDENVLANSNQRAEALRHEIRVGSPRTFNPLNRQWIVGREGEIYNYIYFDVPSAQINKLSVFHLAPKAWRLQSRSFYTWVKCVEPTTGNEKHVTWQGHGGWMREFDRQVEPRAYRTLGDSPIEIEPPSYFATEQPDPASMTYGKLKRFIAELRASGFNVVKYEVELHRKLSFPWVTVIMTLLAIPFAVTTGRKGAMYGIGLGVMLALAYWVSTSVFVAIGSGGAVMPILAAWAPNILFGAAAAYLILTVRT